MKAKAARTFALAALILLVAALCCSVAFDDDRPTDRRPAPAVTSPAGVPAKTAPARRRATTPAVDGKPGAYCATSRLGQSFVRKGVAYTCKGPKPYRWRKS